MKVHFTASITDITEHMDFYRTVVSTVKNSGHTIVRDWLQFYEDDKNQPKYSEKEWVEINKKTLLALKQADAIIIDASVLSFSSGYQAALALSVKKPVLIISNTPKLESSIIMDSLNSLTRIEYYHTKRELREIVTKFLKDNDLQSQDMRFNMFLDREVYNMLRWESDRTGKTKAQIIREVLRKQLKEKD